MHNSARDIGMEASTHTHCVKMYFPLVCFNKETFFSREGYHVFITIKIRFSRNG
jgi:hypothetical protein